MTIDRIVELLKIEQECVTRGATCSRDCAVCDLVQNDKELIEMYTEAIKYMERIKNEPQY